MRACSKQDVVKYITIIKINFENAYNLSDQDMILLTNTWYEILKDYPAEICNAAVINSLKKSKFAPRIGSIVEEIESMAEATEKNDLELWSELNYALRNAYNNWYMYPYTFTDRNGKTQGENARLRNKALYEGLDPILKEYVSDINGLVTLSKASNEELNYEKGRFLKTVPTLRKRAKTRATTSPMLLELISQVKTSMSLPEKSSNERNKSVRQV